MDKVAIHQELIWQLRNLKKVYKKLMPGQIGVLCMNTTAMIDTPLNS